MTGVAILHHNTPGDVIHWVKEHFNSFGGPQQKTFIEHMSEVRRINKAWLSHAKQLGVQAADTTKWGFERDKYLTQKWENYTSRNAFENSLALVNALKDMAIEKAVHDTLGWLHSSESAEKDEFKARLKELEEIMNLIMDKFGFG